MNFIFFKFFFNFLGNFLNGTHYYRKLIFNFLYNNGVWIQSIYKNVKKNDFWFHCENIK